MGLAELSLRAIVAYGENSRLKPIVRVAQLLQSPSSWQQYFADAYKDGHFVYEGLHQSHATRGWTLLPSLHVQRGDVTYTTNREGFRSAHEFVNDPDRYQVVIVGDSFTFGDGIDDTATWPSLLEARNPRLNVLNLAITGYGPDQMYLTLKDALAAYRPQLIVAAYIADDLARSLLDFRDFRKPRFVLDNGSLVLTNTPIGTPQAVLDDVRDEALRSRLQLVNMARALAGRVRESEFACDPECVRLNERIFAAMRDISAARGAQFLLTYLPVGQEMTDAGFQRDGEAFFRTYQASHRGDAFFNSRPELLAAAFDKSTGHYTRAETERLAAMMDREIRALPSWSAFIESPASAARAEGPSSGRTNP